MSKPRYKWWGYIKNVIRAYPGLKREYEDLHEQSITANLSGMPGGGGVSRGTENIAIRELMPTAQKEYEAVKRAVEITSRITNGEMLIKIIALSYWKNAKSLYDAGCSVGYAYKTTRKIHGDFIKLVGFCYGYDLDGRDEAYIRKVFLMEKRGPESQ